MSPSGWRGALVVFAKWPAPGEVKTRLSPPLHPDDAARLYACMLDDALEESARVVRDLDVEGVVALHPGARCADLAAGMPAVEGRAAPFALVAQRGADLSARIQDAFDVAFASGLDRVVVRGSDNPNLTADLIAEVFDALGEVDLAIVPDQDGGYGAVGLRRPAPGLFHHPMSTGSALRDTLENAGRMGLSHRLTRTSFDLDRVEDLRRLSALDDPTARRACARTLSALEALDFEGAA